MSNSGETDETSLPLPSDIVLLMRAKQYSIIFEKHSLDETGFCSFNTSEQARNKEEDDDDDDNEDSGDVSLTSDLETNDNESISSNLSFDLTKKLNATFFAIEKRKKKWRDTGVDVLLDSFCLNDINEKVNNWLENNCLKNGLNRKDKISVPKTKIPADIDSDCEIVSRKSKKNYQLIEQHKKRAKESYSTQMRLAKRRIHNKNTIFDGELMKRHNISPIQEEFCDSIPSNNESSVDTAKYILSNRKRHKTRTSTTQIKRFCNFKLREKENGLCKRQYPFNNIIETSDSDDNELLYNRTKFKRRRLNRRLMKYDKQKHHINKLPRITTDNGNEKNQENLNQQRKNKSSKEVLLKNNCHQNYETSITSSQFLPAIHSTNFNIPIKEIFNYKDSEGLILHDPNDTSSNRNIVNGTIKLTKEFLNERIGENNRKLLLVKYPDLQKIDFDADAFILYDPPASDHDEDSLTDPLDYIHKSKYGKIKQVYCHF